MTEKNTHQFIRDYGIPFGYWPFKMCELQKDYARVLSVVNSEAKARDLVATLRSMFPKERVIHIPAWPCVPYDRQGPRRSIVAAQNNALHALADQKPAFVVTSLRGIFQLYPGNQHAKTRVRTLTTAQEFMREEWIPFLDDGGYLRVDTVRVEGEYAVRGGIFDIFPLGSQDPVRVDLFDTEIEKIFTFDPLSQRRGGEIKTINIPVANQQFNDAEIADIRMRFQAEFGNESGKSDLCQALIAKGFHSEVAWVGEIAHGLMQSLAQLIAPDVIVSDEDISSQLVRFSEEAHTHYDLRIHGDEPFALSPERIFITAEGLARDFAQCKRVYILDSLLHGKEIHPQQPLSLAAAGYINDARHSNVDTESESTRKIQSIVAHARTQGHRLCVAVSSPGNRARLIDMFGALKIKPQTNKSMAQFYSDPGTFRVSLNAWHLSQGCVFNGNVIVADSDVLPSAMSSKKNRSHTDLFIAEASTLSVGDYVVHEDHGVGQFIGLETVDILSAPHDCAVIIYQGDDKLFVPVENIDVLSRYGNQDTPAVLDKLGNPSWQTRRDKVRKDLLEMAKELVEIAAQRERTPATAFPLTGIYHEVVARFPHLPTPDQASAISEVEEDLSSGRLMDRLICGDVGFGKTEIAIRAAAQVAGNGAQVAIVVPTTLLARQHFRNFIDRFEGMPLRIKQLSRFTKPAEVRQIKEDLAKGTVDIVVGTHGLLHQSVSFNNLGLLIVDEEQHFGVKQKERLKKVAKDLHILTLTATPIPRTLQMSLTGVRTLSIMATPPVDRLPVYTQVCEDKNAMFREALMREKSRGGISYVVCPRLSDLDAMKENLIKLLPDFSFAVASGQMHRDDLDSVMTDFADQKFDVLISTNIVESGLDIHDANTMIIYRADMFGLAQLYQLRGRVGRGKARGYGYLTYPKNTVLNSQARRRLEVMESLDKLGAGFQLASYDLDIRGSGNVLGEQQSGHIREVGVEMYQHLLQEALAEMKSTPVDSNARGSPHKSPQINLSFPVLLPEEYIPDLSTRLEVYRRSAKCEDNQELDELRYEVIDRFGALPETALNFFALLELKILCKKISIQSVSVGTRGVVIGFYDRGVLNPERLISFINLNKGTVKLRPDQKLVFIRVWASLEQQMTGLKTILRDLTNALMMG